MSAALRVSKGYQWVQTDADYQLHHNGEPLRVRVMYSKTSWADGRRPTSRHWAAEVHGRVLACGTGGLKTRSWVHAEEAMIAARRCYRDTLVPGEARMTTLRRLAAASTTGSTI